MAAGVGFRAEPFCPRFSCSWPHVIPFNGKLAGGVKGCALGNP